MTDSDKNENTGESIAEEIIEAFGGIRPMAGKLGVPVTTVQGWKKRQAIPETRFEQVLEAAVTHDVGLERAHYAYLGGGEIDDEEIEEALNRIAAAVAEDDDEDEVQDENKAGADEERDIVQLPGDEDDDAAGDDDTDEDEEEIVHSVSHAAAGHKPESKREEQPRHWQPSGRSEKREAQASAAVKKEQKRVVRAVGFSLLAMVLAICAIALVLVGPEGAQKNVEEAKTLQKDIDRLNDLHQRLDKRLATLESSNADLKVRLQRLLENNPAVTPDNGEIVTRLTKLEQDYAELQILEDKVSPFLDKIGILNRSIEGQETLGESMSGINSVVMNMQGRIDELDTALEDARKDDEELAKVLDSVSRDDLTAAAMLLALNQMRSTMNQEQNFEQDLEIVRRLAGDDEELLSAIDRLAPHAESGVLSKQGLSREFKGVAGEIVLAKMAGEDVSVKDKVMGRLGEIVKVRKEDADPDAQDTEAIVARAEALLDEGDVKGAIAELEKLEGEPAEAAAPFMEQARGTAAADDVSTLMISAVAQRLAKGKIKGIDDLKRVLKGRIYGGGKLPDPKGRGLNLNKMQGLPSLNDRQQGLR